MFNARTFFVAGLLSAVTVSLGSPTLAWSPLQYDTKQEHNAGVPTKTIYQELMDRTAKEAAEKEAAEGTKDPDVPMPAALEKAPEKSAAKATEATSEKEALSAIENDAASEKPARAKLEDADSDTDEAKPEEEAPKKKVAGKMPHESFTDPNYFYKKAQVFAQENDFQSALNYINKALELNPEFWAAAYEKGLIYQLAGYDAAAARRYLSLLEHKPDMLAPHIALGMLYRKHGNVTLAEGEYEKAIELNYRYFPAHYNLANLFMDEKELDKALREYKTCLKLDPTNAQVHNNIGVIYQRRNYLEEAIAEFTKATHLNPASQIFADNLTRAQSKIGTKKPKEVQM